jgi:NADH:ubiquinone reductase (non-electrogenic)
MLSRVVAAAAAFRSSAPRMVDVGLGGPEVTVLGGGFGGLYTALRLTSLDWSGGPRPRVTLVDRNDRFTFSPMLYELATGTATSWEVSPLYEDLLAGTDIQFVRGEVSGLDEEERTVSVTPPDGVSVRLLPYDRCVVALGGQPSLDRVPGAAEHALPFYSTADALAVKRRLRELHDAAERSVLRVCVVGGGYIGAELAANMCAH